MEMGHLVARIEDLIRALEAEGENAAAHLFTALRRRSADLADAARDLAYRLFAPCGKKSVPTRR